MDALMSNPPDVSLMSSDPLLAPDLPQVNNGSEIAVAPAVGGDGIPAIPVTPPITVPSVPLMPVIDAPDGTIGAAAGYLFDPFTVTWTPLVVVEPAGLIAFPQE
ncbi:MAG: hypothetical protein ACFB8W_17780 [Elainellaceae cyanobacterium]